MTDFFDEELERIEKEINAGLETEERCIYQIGLPCLAAVVRFDELKLSNKRRKEWRVTRFGDRLTQKRANDCMHVADLFAATRPTYICNTGLIHLARPCNREIYEAALAKLNPNVYQPLKMVDAAINAARVEAGLEPKCGKPAKSDDGKTITQGDLVIKADALSLEKSLELIDLIVQQYGREVVMDRLQELSDAEAEAA